MAWDWGDFDWGALIGAAVDNFSTGKTKKGDINWNQIERLMALDAEMNRINREGLFSSWKWTEGEDGRPTQTQILRPELQSGLNRLIDRANGGASVSSYTRPEQMNSILDAQMAHQMARQGILDPIPELLRAFGDPYASQIGNIPARAGSGYDFSTPQGLDYGQGGVTGPAAPDGVAGGLGGGGGGSDPRFMGGVTIPGGGQGGGGGGGYGGPGANAGGYTGWDWFDNSGWNPFTWHDNYNATDVEKLFGQKDIGSLAGMEAPEKIGKLASWITGVPGLGKLADLLFGYNKDKNYFTPTDPSNPYASDSDASRALNDAFSGGAQNSQQGPLPPAGGGGRGYGWGGGNIMNPGSGWGGGGYMNPGGFGGGIVGGNWGSGGIFGGGSGYFDDPRMIPFIMPGKISG